VGGFERDIVSQNSADKYIFGVFVESLTGPPRKRERQNEARNREHGGAKKWYAMRKDEEKTFSLRTRTYDVAMQIAAI
jgi:hypothetical protein